MTLEAMIRLVEGRTKYFNHESVITAELNSALDVVFQRIYLVSPNVEITFETTGTFSAETQQFDLAATIATSTGGEFYGSKTFYIAQTTGDDYIPVVFMDVNDSRFLDREQLDAQVFQPTFASLVNFGEVRFAPPVPTNTLWRSDWIGKPPNLSLATNCATSVPSPIHEAMTDYATATIFGIIDDDREMSWMRRAEQKITTAIQTIKRRQFQTPQKTQAFPGRSPGWGVFPRG